MPGRVLNLLHTSDCHLDGDMPHKNDRHLTSKHFAAFRKVIDKTLELPIDILLIAGDFFDSNRASEVSTDFAIGELARARCKVVIAPGNHDSIDSGSVYTRVDFSLAGPHVHVLSETCGQVLEFPEIGARVWGPAGTEMDAKYRPLSGIPKRVGDDWHIAIAHGHFMEEAKWGDRWAPVSESDLREAQWDYLALGHWDHYAEVTQGAMRAVYSGSPVAARDGRLGACLHVVLTPGGGVSLERIVIETD